MPRIKAYTNGTSIIPVDSAKIKTIYRCPWTSQLFSNKKKYYNHLQNYRRTRIVAKIESQRMNKMLADLHSQTSFQDIVNWIETHPAFFYKNAMQSCRSSVERVRPMPRDFWVKVTYLNLQWDNQVSNSHNCPANGVTNWGGRDTFSDGSVKPRGYPGYHGQIEYQFSHDLASMAGIFGSDVLEGTGIHTGTGGGISKNRYGFEVKFFEDDWFGLAEYSTMEKLRGTNGHTKSITIGKPDYFAW